MTRNAKICIKFYDKVGDFKHILCLIELMQAQPKFFSSALRDI